MIDRRSLTDHPSLSDTDYVLEGASIRDRFLTAFILRHSEASKSAWPYAARLSDPHPPGISAPLLAAEEEGFSVRIESTYEPLTVRVIDEWFGADDEDDDM
jgi:hypothetical protein